MANELILYGDFLIESGKTNTNKYNSIYIRNLKNNDLSFIIRYRKDKKTKDVVVGKKSEGMTPMKAKKFLEDIKSALRKGENEEVIIKNRNTDAKRTIINPDDIQNMSLNDLSKRYLNIWKEKAESEKSLSKEDKKFKDREGIRKEESLYKSLWSNWDLAIIPFYKLNTGHFIKRIRDLQELEQKKEENGETITVPKYSKKYLLNAITLIQSIIKHTQCTHNPIDSSKLSNSGDGIELKLIKTDFKEKSKKRKGFLNPEQIKKLLNKLRDNPKHRQGYIMSLIMATTGMRPNSCLNLKVKDFNFKHNIINVFDFKRRKYYTCNLTKMVEIEVKSLIEGKHKNKYIFSSEKSRVHNTKLERTPDYLTETINTMFNKNRYGNDRIVVYSFRHSFATNLAKGLKNENGEWIKVPTSIFQIQKLLNHSRIETTISHYTHTTISDSKDTIDSFEEMFF